MHLEAQFQASKRKGLLCAFCNPSAAIGAPQANLSIILVLLFPQMKGRHPLYFAFFSEGKNGVAGAVIVSVFLDKISQILLENERQRKNSSCTKLKLYL